MLSSVVSQPENEILRRIRETHVARENAPLAIRFEDVCKTYRLYADDRKRFFDGITGFRHENLVKRLKRANDHLSFSIRKGESVAFLGRNGAGKSTAMRLIAGVAFADSGTVEVNGRVAAMLELTAGMVNDLTGRENLIVRGLAMGLDQSEIDDIMDDVVDFAELDDYVDQPLRAYSSGMKSRLGFAFASAVQPDILVIDESLSVGDAKFREKCFERIHDIVRDSEVTFCLVTHSESTALEACSRGIVLEDGKAAFDGDIEGALAFYQR